MLKEYLNISTFYLIYLFILCQKRLRLGLSLFLFFPLFMQKKIENKRKNRKVKKKM